MVKYIFGCVCVCMCLWYCNARYRSGHAHRPKVFRRKYSPVECWEHPNEILEIALHTYHYCILFSTHTPINDDRACMSAIAFYSSTKAATICSAQHGQCFACALSYLWPFRDVIVHCCFFISVLALLFRAALDLALGLRLCPVYIVYEQSEAHLL